MINYIDYWQLQNLVDPIDYLQIFVFFIDNEDLLNLGASSSSIFLKHKGYEYIEKLQTDHIASKDVFVAMWFDPSMDAPYDHGIAPAIRECGLEPVRVDKERDGEQLGKIDDYIMARIRGARFVIADFTCASTNGAGPKEYLMRGGVYFEAGFAKGLGREVIWTCREDTKDGVHFDTRRFNHIFWKEPEDLKTRLVDRIIANNLNY